MKTSGDILSFFYLKEYRKFLPIRKARVSFFFPIQSHLFIYQANLNS